MSSHQFSLELSELFRNSPGHVSRAVIVSNGEVYDDTHAGNGSILLDASGSSITYDRLSPARSQARAVFWATGEDAKNALMPLGRPTITLESGVRVGGSIVWTPLGVFQPLEGQSTAYLNGYIVSLDMVDKSESFRNNKWKAPFQTGGGTYKAAIQAIITDRDPGVVDQQLWLYEYTTENAPDLYYTENDDPWSALMELSRSSESELYFAKNGFLVNDQIPDPANQDPVYTLGGDEFRIEVGRRDRRSSIREVFNGVICRGEAPWLLFPISGEYWDEDPASPTYRSGPFGERPKVIGSPIATTNAQCDLIAEAEFHKIAGVSEEVAFDSVKDPMVSVGDIFRVDASVLATSGTAPGLYTLDTLSYPLGASPMKGVVRRRGV